jgi:hypothetical protein
MPSLLNVSYLEYIYLFPSVFIPYLKFQTAKDLLGPHLFQVHNPNLVLAIHPLPRFGKTREILSAVSYLTS